MTIMLRYASLCVIMAAAVLAGAVSVQANPMATDWPDSITVKNQILEGQISSLDADGIRFGTAYGKGTIVIDYKDIARISSGRPFRIYVGEDAVVEGFITGIEHDRLIVSLAGGDTMSIQLDTIVTGLPVADCEASLLRRLRTDFRHWETSLNLGWRYEETTIGKNKVEFGIGVRRRKKPTRLVFEFDYAYELQRRDDSEVVTKDELATFLVGERDGQKKGFWFARLAAEWDKPRSIDKRYFPAAGVGYRFYEDRNHLLQVPVGIGYVDETFTDYEDNAYTSLYIGFESIYTFANGVRMKGNLLYMPGLSDPGDDFLLRFNIDVRMPIIDPVALLLRMTNVNDNNPAPGVGNNKLTTLMAISLDF